MAKVKMTGKAASRIQSATAKKSGGEVKSKSFSARATRAAAKKTGGATND